MSEQTDLSAIYLRIKKLLALAADGRGNEHEMTLAAEKAQQLMEEYNVTMSHVEAAGQKSEGGTRTKDQTKDRTVYVWRRELMKAIAELNFCFCEQDWEYKDGYRNGPQTFAGYTLIGREANVASTRIMFEYLIQTIDRLTKEVIVDPKGYFTRYAFSFRKGMADRLMDRLREQREAEIRKQEAAKREAEVRAKHPSAATDNALVVSLGDVVQQEKDLNEDFRRGWEPGTTARRRAEYEAERSARRVKFNALVDEIVMEQGVSREVAWYLASGYEMPMALYLAGEGPNPKGESKPETEAQRRKREEKEARANRNYWDRQARKDAKLDLTGYRAGHEAGDRVSLNKQAGHDDKGKLS